MADVIASISSYRRDPASGELVWTVTYENGSTKVVPSQELLDLAEANATVREILKGAIATERGARTLADVTEMVGTPTTPRSRERARPRLPVLRSRASAEAGGSGAGSGAPPSTRRRGREADIDEGQEEQAEEEEDFADAFSQVPKRRREKLADASQLPSYPPEPSALDGFTVLNTRIAVLRADRNALEERVAELRDTGAQLERDIADKNAVITALNTNLSTKTSELRNSEDELVRSKEQLVETTSELANRETELSRLRLTLTGEEQNLSRTRTDLDTCNARLASMQDEVTSLQDISSRLQSNLRAGMQYACALLASTMVMSVGEDALETNWMILRDSVAKDPLYWKWISDTPSLLQSQIDVFLPRPSEDFSARQVQDVPPEFATRITSDTSSASFLNDVVRKPMEQIERIRIALTPLLRPEVSEQYQISAVEICRIALSAEVGVLERVERVQNKNVLSMYRDVLHAIYTVARGSMPDVGTGMSQFDPRDVDRIDDIRVALQQVGIATAMSEVQVLACAIAYFKFTINSSGRGTEGAAGTADAGSRSASETRTGEYAGTVITDLEGRLQVAIQVAQKRSKTTWAVAPVAAAGERGGLRAQEAEGTAPEEVAERAKRARGGK